MTKMVDMDILISKFGPKKEAASGSDTVPLQHWKYIDRYNGHNQMRLMAGLNFCTDERPWDYSGYAVYSKNGSAESERTYDDSRDLVDDVLRDPPAVFHTHTRGKRLIEIAKALKKKDTTVVHTMHGMDSLEDRNDRRLFEIADAITSPSCYACRGIAAIDGGRHAYKIFQIPNSTDFTDYKWDKYVQNTAHELRQKYLRNGSRIILTTGRLDPDKGVYELGEAVADLISDGQDLVFMHAGMVIDGSNEECLTNIFRERGFENRLVLLGKIEHESEPKKLAAVYWASDIFVLPSDGTYENFPMSALEALAMEKPTIVSNIGGPREIYVNPGLAIGVPPRNTEMIKKALSYVLGNYDSEKQRAMEASRQIEANYHSRIVTGMLVELYEALMRGDNPGDDIVIPKLPISGPKIM